MDGTAHHTGDYADYHPVPLAWATILAAEPRLAVAEDLARLGGDECDWVAIKRAFEPLIGWDAKSPFLRSQEVFHFGYNHLRDTFELAGESAEGIQ